MTETLEQTLTAYDAWLDRQPLAAHLGAGILSQRIRETTLCPRD